MRIQAINSKNHSILGVGLLALTFSACGGQPPPPAAAPPPAATAPVAAMPAPSAAPAPTAAAPAATAAPAAAAPAEQHGHRMHHPIVAMLMEDLAQVGIKPEQKSTIDGIQADLEKLGDATKDAKAALDKDVADGVAAGKLDKSKVDADVKKLVAAADSTAAAAQEAVNKLHKTLDAAQRKKLVELVRAKGKDHEEHMKAQMADHEKNEHGRMDKIAEHLGLTAEQKDKLKAKLEAGMKGEMGKMKEHHAGMQKHMKALGDAFESDKFDAKKVGVGEHMGEMAKMMANGRIRFVEAVLTVLTPEQRAKFAEHVKQHADDED